MIADDVIGAEDTIPPADEVTAEVVTVSYAAPALGVLALLLASAVLFSL